MDPPPVVPRQPVSRPTSPAPFKPVPSTKRISKQLIEPLLKRPDRIRNVCILAHVDHGKTTLTDSLLASNGIISFKQAGTLRYMDAREDEQIRGITMESSAVSLLFDLRPELTISRSPSTASLNLDEAGSTSSASISRSFEGLAVGDRRFLVNLIDSPGHVDFSSQVATAAKLCDGCLVLVDAVEGVCTQTAAVLRQAYRDRLTPCLVINKMDRLVTELKLDPTEAADWLYKLLSQVNAIQATISSSKYFVAETEDDLQLLVNKESVPAQPEADEEDGEVFCPSKGNVIFASATDGWAFRIDHFARLFSKKLGITETVLQQTLWGEYYMDTKAKRVLGKKAAEKASLTKPMFAQFILDNIWPVYESTSKDGWDQGRIEKIAHSLNVRLPLRELKARDGKTVLRSIMTSWLPLADSAFAAIVDQLPNPADASSIRIPSMFSTGPQVGQLSEISKELEFPPTTIELLNTVSTQAICGDSPMVAYLSKQFAVTTTEGEETTEKLVGMVRLFNGSLSVGQRIYVLRPKYHPSHSDRTNYVHEVVIEQLYLLMGRDLEPVDKVYAGNVFGIGGLEQFVGKSATLSDTLDWPSFEIAHLHKVVPIVRVALHPSNLNQMNQLETGLKLLCQADPCAETFLSEENGEHILAAAGELHLEQCLKDLRERFTKIEIEVSPPMVPFRETISDQSCVNDSFWKDGLDEARGEGLTTNGALQLLTPNKNFKIAVRAIPLPSALASFIITNKTAIKNIQSPLSFEDSIVKEILGHFSGFKAEQILAFGPRRCGPNMLFASEAALAQLEGEFKEFLNSILSGFQIAVGQGPLCAESMMGVGFIVESIEKVDWPSEDESEHICSLTNAVKGQLISTSKDAMHRAFMYKSPRLMLAMYSCDIQSTAEVIGRVYSVVSRRLGTILAEEYNDGTGFFTVKSLIPVIESFGFADDIRGRTSGLAIPQLIFHGFQTYDQDPFWVPTTEEELEEFGEVAEKANVALKYLIGVRERKGLFVERKIVQFAEKQRTLKK